MDPSIYKCSVFKAKISAISEKHGSLFPTVSQPIRHPSCAQHLTMSSCVKTSSGVPKTGHCNIYRFENFDCDDFGVSNICQYPLLDAEDGMNKTTSKSSLKNDFSESMCKDHTLIDRIPL